MAEKLATQLTARLSGAGRGALQIVPHTIEDDDGFVIAQYTTLANPYLWLRLYPAVNAKLRAAVGSVISDGVRAERVTNEVVVFTGQAQAQTKYPASGGLALDYEGMTFDADGHAISAHVGVGADGALHADPPFYGAVIVSYDTTFKLLKYSYGFESFDGGLLAGAITGGLTSGGGKIKGGAVLAFYGGEVASYTPPAPELPSEEGDRTELWRDVSYAIETRDGVYERPVGWTGAAGSPTWAGGKPDPEEWWNEIERVHKVALLDQFCRPVTRSYYVPAGMPYQTDSSYTIPVTRIQNSGGGASGACADKANTILQGRP